MTGSTALGVRRAHSPSNAARLLISQLQELRCSSYTINKVNLSILIVSRSVRHSNPISPETYTTVPIEPLPPLLLDLGKPAELIRTQPATPDKLLRTSQVLQRRAELGAIGVVCRQRNELGVCAGDACWLSLVRRLRRGREFASWRVGSLLGR